MAPEPISIKYGLQLPAAAVLNTSLVPLLPTILSWSRLEPLPYTADLGPALQAQLGDPLWMLARQWQFAEFQGEDAGSPIGANLVGENARLSRYRPGPLSGAAAVAPLDYQHLEMPLEVLVERETARFTHPRLAAEAGEHLLRLLSRQGVTGARPILRQSFALEIPAEALPAPDADLKGKAWQALFAGRALDGRALAAALRPFSTDGPLSDLPAEFAFDAAQKDAVQAAAGDWLRWYDAFLNEPTAEAGSAWIPQRQEYALALSARFGDGVSVGPGNEKVILAADEYNDGRLDWYSFTAASTPDLGEPAVPVPAEIMQFRPLLPTPVRYPGMPADRFWEFEDARVSLGSLEAGPTDLGRLLLAEYGLVFGNDWFVIPVELPVGSVFRVKSFTVRDTFGVTANVGPSRNLDGTRWTMFLQSSQPGLPAALQDLFFLPPTLPYRLEGDPLEEVALFRDEMANMAWAVEHKVQGAAGMAMDRRMEPPTPAVHQRIAAADITAALIYRLMTPVPEQWLPFVPVPANDNQPLFRFSIGLERRALLRTLADGSRREIHPRGLLLRTDLTRPVQDEPPLRLFEEEVPRDGAMVERNFQYTRWMDGRRYLWVGRSKRVGRGSGNSGLRFDASLFTAEHTAPIANQEPINRRSLTPLT